jgi:hypothetical protein
VSEHSDPQTLTEFRRDALAVVSTGFIADPDDGSLVAAMVLDASARPDVADLTRVHALEGVGDLRCGLGVYDVGPPASWLVRLEVAVDHPVHCRFHAVVDWASHRPWLTAVADGGAVAIGTGDDSGYWLRLNVDAARVGPVLELLDQRSS